MVAQDFFKGLKFIRRPRKKSVEKAELLMELSKRDLAEAKRLRKKAEDAKPVEREELLRKVMQAVHNSRKYAEEAERLVAR